jgi:hypothetical protein
MLFIYSVSISVSSTTKKYTNGSFQLKASSTPSTLTINLLYYILYDKVIMKYIYISDGNSSISTFLFNIKTSKGQIDESIMSPRSAPTISNNPIAISISNYSNMLLT